jgi:GGDEF domain-containing protein
LLWAVIYLLLKLILFNEHPMLGGIYTYLSITELAFLILLVTLAHPVGQALLEYTQAVELVTLAKNGRGLLDVSQAADLIRSEMNRSRHFNRPLSVILACLDEGAMQMRLSQFIQEAQVTFVHRYATGRLAEITRKELRRMDIVLGDYRKGQVIVLSPESDSRHASILVERIRAAAAEELGVNIQCGSASFPEQALSFEELVRQAEVKINGHAEITTPVKSTSI